MAAVITLIGATASGKTDLAGALYQRFPLRLISVDSAQIYRGMDIGTAKPSAAFLKQYPHDLIDCCEPEEHYSAARFCQDAHQAIAKAHADGKIPLLVGGTMLYYHALFSGLSDLPPADAQLRAEIMAEMHTRGLPALYADLLAYDPEQANKIAANDTQRIIRFTELFRQTGQPPSALFAQQKQAVPTWNSLHLALLPERHLLHQAIAQRFQTMMAAGFLEEVARLKMRPKLTAEHSSMRSVGYRQLWRHLDGEIDLETAVELSIIATRQLAKRQITWLNNRLKTVLSMHFYDPYQAETQNRVFEQVAQFCKHNEGTFL